MVRKLYLSGFFLLLSIITGPVLFAQNNIVPLPYFQLLGSGSLGYANNPEMADFIKEKGEAARNYLNTNVSGAYNTFSADNSKANFTYGFELELRFYFNSFGIGFGGSYDKAGTKSKATSSNADLTNNITNVLGLTVKSGSCTLFYRIPVTKVPGSFVLIGAGAGSYSGLMKHQSKDDDGIYPDNSFTVKGNKTASGFHALIEYNYVINNSGETIFTGLKGRYVEFDKFSDDLSKASLTGISWYAGFAFSL